MGLAGCHIENQVAEKRCGHLENKELISTSEMVKKIKDSVASRKDKDIVAQLTAEFLSGSYANKESMSSNFRVLQSLISNLTNYSVGNVI